MILGGFQMLKKTIWTYDDLITNYIVEKLRTGYDPISTRDELIDFLSYIDSFVNAKSSLMSYSYILDQYIYGEGSKRKIWNESKQALEYVPMVEQQKPDFISPTYHLTYEESEYAKDKELETYFQMYIFRHCNPRKIDFSTSIDKDTEQFGQAATAAMILQNWNRLQLSAIGGDLLSFYSNTSKRMMHLAQDDSDFQMTTRENEILANENYNLIMRKSAYDQGLRKTQQSLFVDRKKGIVQTSPNSQEEGELITNLDNPKVLKLVKDFNVAQDNN